MGKNLILVLCVLSILLIPLMINASFTVSGGIYGRIFGNTGEWVGLDPRISEYYDLNLSFGFFAQVFFNSIFGVEAGMMTWNGEYQTEFYDPWHEALQPEYDIYGLNSVSPYISIVVRPVKYLFFSAGKYLSGKVSLKNYFFVRAGVKLVLIKSKLPVCLIGFGDYYLNKNDGENFWTLNLGLQLN